MIAAFTGAPQSSHHPHCLFRLGALPFRNWAREEVGKKWERERKRPLLKWPKAIIMVFIVVYLSRKKSLFCSVKSFHSVCWKFLSSFFFFLNTYLVLSFVCIVRTSIVMRPIQRSCPILLHVIELHYKSSKIFYFGALMYEYHTWLLYHLVKYFPSPTSNNSLSYVKAWGRSPMARRLCRDETAAAYAHTSDVTCKLVRTLAATTPSDPGLIYTEELQ